MGVLPQSHTSLNDVLEHHGVKGMKWGVRRSKRELSGGRSGGQSKKKLSDMSDEELRARVNRMNMEQSYNRMKKQHPGKAAVLAGAGFVGAIALGVARSQITNEANRRVGAAIATHRAREAAVSGLRRLG